MLAVLAILHGMERNGKMHFISGEAVEMSMPVLPCLDEEYKLKRA